MYYVPLQWIESFVSITPVDGNDKDSPDNLSRLESEADKQANEQEENKEAENDEEGANEQQRSRQNYLNFKFSESF